MDQAEKTRRTALIVEQYKGVLPYYEAFYIRAVIYAAERSEAAFERFEAVVAEAGNAEAIMAMVQEALTHAAALSRFFWPASKSNPLAVARGGRLRQAFSLNDTSSLRDRALRNAFEHFDEHLDRFLLEEPTGYLFPDPLIEDQSLAEESIGKIFRLVDPVHGVCVLLGTKFEYRPIRAEVRDILTRAQKMDEHGSRLRR